MAEDGSAVPRVVGYSRFGRQFRGKSLKRFFSRSPPEGDRVISVDNYAPQQDQHNKPIVYPDNTVVSSKYTLLTFLPKNLFEQFRRVANFYFLCVALIQFVIDTPVTPLTSVLPLAFVITVTAVKQGYEDWLRHKADNEVNLRPAMVVRHGNLQEDVRAMDIKVGDIVKVLTNEEFPCDLVMLSSADPQGQCFITTANLDGETNLKTHYCLTETRTYDTPESLGQLRATINCKPPIADLYAFEGTMEFESSNEMKPLGPENLLLRGARLKNTEYIYGCAVYTGRDTRMALNSKFKQTKFSRVERKMNNFLITFLVILLVESVLATGMKYLHESNHTWPWYVDKDSNNDSFKKVVEHALAFMVLFNYIIPISLYVTIELQKFLGSIFFGWDREMYDETTNSRAIANTSDLNEELGQVEYLFTDKTGTLTENTMMFRRCCIGSRQFEEVDGKFCERKDTDIILGSDLEFTKEMDDFLKVLVLCHTVRVDRHAECRDINGASTMYSTTGEEYEYQASSPDEKALVEACCKYGTIYHGLNDDVLEVSFHGEMKRFKLLHTLPFDPVRKRMSVIIEDEDGARFLLCKGAEVAILDRIVAGDIETTERLIQEYAVLGLRTLTIANRRLPDQEFEEVDKRLTEAKLAMNGREEKLAEAYNEIETKLTLLGATAVEDKLQDQVPQTLEALRLAGIKVWVLTGDKEETAVNISYSAGHFDSEMEELRLTQVTSAEQCKEQLEVLLKETTLNSQTSSFALIIDGRSLAYAIRQHKDWLRDLCSRCVAVLCCRMSPLQKAEVVAMIKDSSSRPVTAAVGDGANDVSMIQEADVGLGIMGKEGRQAVRNSDYAFGKFRFLRRALLLHGNLYYNRIAILVQYFFYKNIAWITSQMYYAIFSAWSEQSLFDPFFLVFYNLTFTSLPILIYGLFEIHKPKEVLLNNPLVYKAVTRNALLSWPEFIRWNLLGLWHSCVFFFGHYFVIKDGISIFKTGETIGNFDFGSLILYTCVTAVNIKLMLETYYWCLPTFLSYIITFLGLIVLSAIYTNVFWPKWLVSTNDMFEVLNNIYATPTTWFAMLLLILMALMPDIFLRVFKDFYWTKKYGRSRSSSKNTAKSATNGQAQVMSIPPQHLGVDRNAGNSAAENIELREKARKGTGKPVLIGYVNPALTLSSENIRTSSADGLSQSDIHVKPDQSSPVSHNHHNSHLDINTKTTDASFKTSEEMESSKQSPERTVTHRDSQLSYSGLPGHVSVIEVKPSPSPKFKNLNNNAYSQNHITGNEKDSNTPEVSPGGMESSMSTPGKPSSPSHQHSPASKIYPSSDVNKSILETSENTQNSSDPPSPPGQTTSYFENEIQPQSPGGPVGSEDSIPPTSPHSPSGESQNSSPATQMTHF